MRFVGATGADHEGAMVALKIPPEVANQLEIPGGEPADDMHITLAYFKDKAADRNDWGSLHDMLGNIAAQHLPLSGAIGGQGKFVHDEGKHPHWASVDIPGLEDLHHHLVGKLEQAGFPVSHDHGFTPHVTLKYADPEEDIPQVVKGQIPLEFNHVTLHTGGDQKDLGPAPMEKAATQDWGQAEPEYGDYAIQYGSHHHLTGDPSYNVYHLRNDGTKALGQFAHPHEAYEAVDQHQEKSGYFPNVWHMDSAGDLHEPDTDYGAWQGNPPKAHRKEIFQTNQYNPFDEKGDTDSLVRNAGIEHVWI